MLSTFAAVIAGAVWATSFVPGLQSGRGATPGWTIYRYRDGLGSSLMIERGAAEFVHSYWDAKPDRPHTPVKWGPFLCEYQSQTDAAWWIVHLPLWFPFVLLSVIPILAVIGVLRRSLQGRRRGRQGLCSNCGYNLTGNESGACSECGTEFASGPNETPP